MNKFTVAMKKFGGFMKRNAFYFLIVLCIASISAVIGLAVTNNLNPSDTDINVPVIKPDDPDPPKKQTFLAPSNGTIIRDYCDDAGVWNPTLDQYETHIGLDFTSTDLGVFASSDGVVKEVGYNDLDGNYIFLSHENGYETHYYSLEAMSTLKVGAAVEQGQNLGNISASHAVESHDGNHLHFEMYKDGVVMNPLEVLILEEK